MGVQRQVGEEGKKQTTWEETVWERVNDRLRTADQPGAALWRPGDLDRNRWKR